MDWIYDNLVLVLIVLVVVAIAAILLFRPKQRVRLNEPGPVRPHMMARDRHAGEGRGLSDEMAAATSDVAGDIIDARVHDNLPGASGPPDDLQRLKGVGPKFAQLLNQRGIIRFEQLARLTPGEVERLDSSLGPFRGRLDRDRVIEQADYLARGDEEGFELRFGKL